MIVVSSEVAVSVEVVLSNDDDGEVVDVMEVLRRRNGMGKDGRRYVGKNGEGPVLGDEDGLTMMMFRDEW